MTFIEFISLPKSLYFNLRVLPFKEAIKLPFFIHYNTKLYTIPPVVKIEAPIERGMIKIGFGGLTSITSHNKNYIELGGNAELVFKGRATISNGVALTVLGKMVVGDNFISNDNLYVSCHDEIILGDDVLFGWDVHLFDSDNHVIINVDGTEKTEHAPIRIGNHVWVGAYAHFLKGASVSDDSVVAYKSLVTKTFDEPQIIVGGMPAKKMSKIDNWRG